MEESVNKETLLDLFAGRLTLLQRKLVEDWLKLPGSQAIYYECLDEWERQHLQYVTDDDTALQASWTAIGQWEQQRVSSGQPMGSIRPLLVLPRWLVAAVLTLMVLAGGTYASRTYWLYHTLTTAYGEVRQEQLSDGSLVTLNAHSSLRVPRFGFGSRTREVYLMGEAAFSIKHMADNKQFVVRTGKTIDVVVMGTEFTVSTRQRQTKVLLNRGKVQLNYQSPAQKTCHLLMKPGDIAGIDQTGKLAVRHTTDPKVQMAWQQHQFVFNKTTMGEIAELLHDDYDLTVTLKGDQLANRTVSGSFQAHTADELLRVVAELLEINYTQQDKTVTFF